MSCAWQRSGTMRYNLRRSVILVETIIMVAWFYDVLLTLRKNHTPRSKALASLMYTGTNFVLGGMLLHHGWDRLTHVQYLAYRAGIAMLFMPQLLQLPQLVRDAEFGKHWLTYAAFAAAVYFIGTLLEPARAAARV